MKNCKMAKHILVTSDSAITCENEDPCDSLAIDLKKPGIFKAKLYAIGGPGQFKLSGNRSYHVI